MNNIECIVCFVNRNQLSMYNYPLIKMIKYNVR